MANYCNYEVHVRGTRKAALLLYAMLPSADEKYIVYEDGTDDEYVVWVTGDCKGSLDAYCKENTNIRIDPEELSEDDVLDVDRWTEYWYLTMRQKSEVLAVEIIAHSWSRESEFERIDHYRKGERISSKQESHVVHDELEDWDLFPKWDKNEYDSYEKFCAAVKDFFGFDISTIHESKWEPDEGTFFGLPMDAWMDYRWDYMDSLYPSAKFEFDF